MKLKCQLHCHSKEDPKDYLQHSAEELLEEAAHLNYQAVAITLHTKCLFTKELYQKANAFGILLIPGCELRIEGKDILAYGMSPQEAHETETWKDLHKLKTKLGKELLLIAPHVGYILGGALSNKKFEEEIGLFDALELCFFKTKYIQPDKKARRIAALHNIPLVATADAHCLSNLDQGYFFAETNEATQPSVFEAIRTGKIQNHSPELTNLKFIKTAWETIKWSIIKIIKRRHQR